MQTNLKVLVEKAFRRCQWKVDKFAILAAMQKIAFRAQYLYLAASSILTFHSP